MSDSLVERLRELQRDYREEKLEVANVAGKSL